VPRTELRKGVLCLFSRWAANVVEEDSGFALGSEREKICSVSRRAGREISKLVCVDEV